jgi:hypothetical protein
MYIPARISTFTADVGRCGWGILERIEVMLRLGADVNKRSVVHEGLERSTGCRGKESLCGLIRRCYLWASRAGA